MIHSGGPVRSLLAGGEDSAFTFEELLFAMVMLMALWVGGAIVKGLGSPDLVCADVLCALSCPD